MPRRLAVDAVAEVYDEWVSETDVVYYAVSIDDSRTSKRIKPMVNGKDWEFEILLDENSDLKRAFGVSTVPYTTIIKNGRVVYKHTGYTPGYEDELYNQALEIIKAEGKASTSFLQRKLQIGYNRAARMIDRMEENGIVSKANHTGKREVL